MYEAQMPIFPAVLQQYFRSATRLFRHYANVTGDLMTSDPATLSSLSVICSYDFTLPEKCECVSLFTSYTPRYSSPGAAITSCHLER
ncbi:hypothetical protein E2C01_097596 [Portunus trituberculatus]|uniref:Uncharacterized protein n=1 Tax=Portunus trituberculatus TaxID=210409 RepID=A0A5B7JZ16_PORTR|nr:hypothetical protein [Portunus trituberculatus]